MPGASAHPIYTSVTHGISQLVFLRKRVGRLHRSVIADNVPWMAPAKSLSRIGASVGLSVLIIALGGLSFGPRGLAVGIVAAFLMLAWRHDNSLGLLIPIAMLIVITIAVLLLLMYLMARMHS